MINTPNQLFTNHLSADPKAPLGLLQIAAYIRQFGATVKILDCHASQWSLEEIIGQVKQRNPLVIGLNATTPNRQTAFQLITRIKDNLPNSTIIAGGPHATCLPQDFFAHSPVDGVVLGEGEFAVQRILQNLPRLESFPGFCTRLDMASPIQCQISPRIENLDDLPLPAYDLIDVKQYLSFNPELYVSSGRGCNHNCVFCSARVQLGSSVYFRSSASTIHEIQQLKTKYDVNRFYFFNENFSIWPDLEPFCANVENLKIRWSAQININDLDPDLIPHFSAAGCYALGIGFESGSSRMQKYIGKPIGKDAPDKITKLEKAGIYARGFFVIGFPDEDEQSILETARYLISIRNAGLKDIAIFPARPYPGTRLYQDLLAEVGQARHDEILDYQYLEDYHETEDTLIKLKLQRYNTVPSFKVCKNFHPFQIRRIIEALYKIFYDAKVYDRVTDVELSAFLFKETRKV